MLITGSATVLLGATFDGGIWLLLAGFFVLASGFGSIAPNVVALAMSDHPEVAGSAAALMGAAQFVVAGVLAPIAGVGGGGAIALGLVLTVIAVVAALTGAFALRRVGPGSA